MHFIFDEDDGSGNDSSVVAEQESAHRGQDRQLIDKKGAHACSKKCALKKRCDDFERLKEVRPDKSMSLCRVITALGKPAESNEPKAKLVEQEP